LSDCKEAQKKVGYEKEGATRALKKKSRKEVF